MGRPRKDLAPFVESYIHYTAYRPEHRVERVIPNGRIYLIVELDGMTRHVYENERLEPIARFDRVWLSGAQRRYISIEARHDSSMFVIEFKYGSSRPFLPRAVDQFTDRIVRGEEVFGYEVCRIRGSLIQAASPEKSFAVADRWLAERMQPNLTAPDFVQAAVAGIAGDPTFARTSLGRLIRGSGYSQKQFIHRFKEHVGLTPKRFQRIMRFQEILSRIADEDEVSWPEISLECGYYDQSHFIREFKEFSGYNPARFLSRVPDRRTNFFPLSRG